MSGFRHAAPPRGPSRAEGGAAGARSHLSERVGRPARDEIVEHETASRPLTGYAFDYPDGLATGRHNHPRAQLLYATRGTMRVATDATLYVVPPGRALWIPAHLPHAVTMDGAVAMRALFLREDAAAAGPPAPAVIAVSELLRALILAACAEGTEWDERGRGRHIAALATDEIARARALKLGLAAPRDPRALKLATALLADPADARDGAALAAFAGASERTLHRLFTAETGMGLARWRREARLTRAAALLAEGMSPGAVAAKVGYASAPAFGAAFRAAFGITPGEAARQRGEDAA